MGNSTWLIIVSLGCFFVIALITIVMGAMLTSFLKNSVNKDARTERENISKHKQMIRAKGSMTAPAVIISAKKVGMWGGNFVDFEAEVKPANDAPFRVKFRDELYGEAYEIVDQEVVSEVGRKISVTYDSKDKTRAFLDHYDDEYEIAKKNIELSERRVEFEKLIDGNEDLKIRGEQAEAIITRVEDLSLPYPQKNSRAMHLYFDVEPKNGPVFQAEGNALIVTTSLKKYSVGKRVYVRYDPQQPEKAVLDTLRNKSLP